MLLNDVDFGAQVEPYRRELRAHCYRMMGSLTEADDMVQETLVRAWRRRDTLESPAALRAWLYKIATNVCLDALRQRPRRGVPRTRRAASTLADPIPPDQDEPIWLEPYPDALLPDLGDDPEARALRREQIALAFIIALHILPARQRAALILREVLGMSAREIAMLLETTEAAVKSALYRARATLDAGHRPAQSAAAPAQLDAYLRAWEAADADALARLLIDDAVFSMPPIPLWYRGRETIRALTARTVFGGEARGRWRLLPAHANAQPAFGLYRQAGTPGHYAAYGIQVLTFADAGLAEIITFRVPALFPAFGLPDSLA